MKVQKYPHKNRNTFIKISVISTYRPSIKSGTTTDKKLLQA